MNTFDIYELAVIKGRLKYAFERLKNNIIIRSDIPKVISSLYDKRFTDHLIEHQWSIMGGNYLVNTNFNHYVVTHIAKVNYAARAKYLSDAELHNDPVVKRLIDLNLLNVNLEKLYTITEADLNIEGVAEDRKKIRDRNLKPMDLFGTRGQTPTGEVTDRIERINKVYDMHANPKGPNEPDIFIKAKDGLREDAELEFSPAMYRSGLKRLSLMMHCGPHFVNPDKYRSQIIKLLDVGVPTRVLINSPAVVKELVTHMEGDLAMYAPIEKIMKAWRTLMEDYPLALEVRTTDIPLMHRCYLAEYEEKTIVSSRYYTFANDVNKQNPVLVFDSENEQSKCQIYQKEFEYLWDRAKPLDETMDIH